MSSARGEGRRGAAGQWAGRAIAVGGLLAVTVTQPVLDLFGRNPPFFTAGGYDDGQIVAFALVVALLPVAVAALALAVAAALHPRLGDAAHLAIVVGVGAVLGNVVLRAANGDGLGWAILAALAGAAFVAWFDRTRPGRLLLQYLAVSQVLFVAGFVVMSPTAGLLGDRAWKAEVGRVELPELRGPVVLVVLDELPVTTLLGPDGSIDGARYPGFAALAERTTWFRNASSNDAATTVAVPSLLTGRHVTADQLPSYQDHPRNLFTLLGGAVPIERHEPVTDLCPPELCPRDDPEPLRQAVEDAAVVYGHRVLPPELRDELPEIGATWGGFGIGEPMTPELQAALRDPMLKLYLQPRDQKHPAAQLQVLASTVASIRPQPELHVVHVTSPHQPWLLTPWGTSLRPDWPRPKVDDADTAWDVRLQYQLHALQVGATDRQIGALVDHLDASAIWDRATVVVVADHGVSLNLPDPGRTLSQANAQELLRVPLFIGDPGLEAGSVVDEPAQLVDVLPTLVDVLGIETDWRFDGHSLIDGSSSETNPAVGTSLNPIFDLARGHLSEHRFDDGWRSLLAVGRDGDLVGLEVGDLEPGPASELRWRMEPDVPLPAEAGAFPHLLFGVVVAPGGDPPPELLVAVDGEIAGVAGGYARVEGGWRFSAVLAEPAAGDVARVDLFEVAGAGAERQLRRVG